MVYRVSSSKKEKMKRFTSVVLFADDGGVRADLDHMERLAQDLLHIEVDEILRDVKGLARYLKHSETERQNHAAEILEHLQDNTASLQRVESTLSRVDNTVRRIRSQQDLESSQKEHQSHLKTIQEALLLDPTEVARQQQQQRKLRSSRLEGTGEWLLQNPVFQRWCQADEPELDLITLIGDEGYGKSHICSHVIDHVSTQDTREAENSIVAYFYFNREGNRTKLQKCLASIIHQIASADEKYAKVAATACRNKSGLASAEALWAALVANSLRDLAGLYFLVICSHGLERDEVSFLKNLTGRALSPSPDNNIRLFLSTDNAEIGRTRGTPIVLSSSPWHGRQSLQITPFQTKVEWIDRIKGRVRMVNERDMQLFVGARVQELCQDPDFKVIALDADTDIISALVEGPCGDDGLLVMKLKEIEDCDTDRAIKETLLRADEGRAQTLQRILVRLNGTLTPSDIDLLNEILIWVFTERSRGSNLQLLQAALFHAHGTKYHVRAKIEAKDLLRLDDIATVHCVYTLEDPEKAMSRQSNQVEAPSTVSTPLVTGQEVQTIESLVRAHCDADVYQRFQFAEWFEEKMKLCIHTVRIGTSAERTGHVLPQCLDSLCTRSQDQDPSALRKYAKRQFMEHQLDVDLESTQESLLLSLGDRVAAIFGDLPTVDAWTMGEECLCPMHYLLSDNIGGGLLKLLQHPKVVEGYSSSQEHHQYMNRSVSTTGRPCRVLTLAALRMASRYMCGDTDDMCDFCNGAVIMSNVWMPPQDNADDPLSFASEMSHAEIDRFFQWLRDQHPCHLLERSVWEERRIRVLRHLGRDNEVLRTVGHCSAPKTIGDVRFLTSVSACHLATGEITQALDVLSIAKQAATQLRKTKMQDPMDPLRSSDYDGQGIPESLPLHWDAMDRAVLLQEGKCQYARKDLEAAAKILGEVIRAEVSVSKSCKTVVKQWRCRKSSEGFEARDILLQIWLESSQWQTIIDELLAWRKVSVLGAAQIFAEKNYHGKSRFESVVLEASWRTGSWRRIHALYRDAMNELREDSEGSDTLCLRDFRFSNARLLLHCSDDPLDHNSAILDLEFNIQAGILRAELIRSLEVEELALFLVEKALEERLNNPHVASVGHYTAYTRRLQKLADRERPPLEHTFIRSLARLHMYNGKVEEARSCLLGIMQDALYAWSKEDEFVACSGDELARILRIVDDRPNALACQARSWPFRLPERFPGILNCIECDAHRGLVNAADMYWCQDCGNTKLCPECYQRCMDGDLCPTICRKWHSHIHVTPEVVAQQAAAGPDMISVNGEAIPLKQWLDQLRAEWKLDPESIRQREEQKRRESEASQFIGSWWKKPKAAT